jgi:outer membrane receptor protein involved in Fe transport
MRVRFGKLLSATASAAAALLAAPACSEEATGFADPRTSIADWISSVMVSGHIEAGATMNPAAPDNGVNFGHLFTDKANQIVLNQFVLTAERLPNPALGRLDFGFRLQGMYGMDSQFTHFLGLGDQATTSRNSFDLVQASALVHAPLITPGGVDFKVGLFTTPLGYEVIDPTGNFFYSKSYIFNFGIPRKHAGVLATFHVRPSLDLLVGYTTGVNTTFGGGGGYNDEEPHLLGGVAMDLGRVSVRALTHIGPEDPPSVLPPGVNPHGRLRYLNDVVVAWKVTDNLTSVTELNYIRDDGLRASGGGVAEYLTYPLSRGTTAGIRAEVWRDANGRFVAGYPGNLDYVNAEQGLPNQSYTGGPATYAAVTVGLNIKPRGLPTMINGLTVRPELRYDRVLSGRAPFGSRLGTARDQITLGVDVVVPLAFPSAKAGPPRGPKPSPPAPDMTEAEHAEAAHGQAIGKQELPGAVTRVNGVPQPKNLDDLTASAPNVYVGGAGVGPGTMAATIRGLGDSEANRTRSPAVGLVVDDVPIGGNLAQLVDSFDVESLEVDRGPSEVFHGGAAPGGLVIVQRTRPTGKWGLDLDYGLEQGYHADIETLRFNMPVGAMAGLKLFFSHRRRAGYLNNVYTGNGLYGRDEVTTGNLRLDWKITPRMEADFDVTLAHQDGAGAPLALGDPLAARLLGPSLVAATPNLQFNAYGSPYIPGATGSLGPFQTANDFVDRNSLVAGVYSLNLTYNAPLGRFRSITAFLDENDGVQQDLDGGCGLSDLGGRACLVVSNPLVGFLHLSRSGVYRQFTQELTFTRDFGDRAALLAGAYYYRHQLNETRTTNSGRGGFALLSASIASHDVLESKAAFGNLIFRPTGRLRLSAGLRVVGDDTSFSQQIARQTSFAGSQEMTRVLTRFSIDYSLTKDALVYALRSTGFRPGGLSSDSTLSEQVPGQTNYDPRNTRATYSMFGPESDTTYEIGLKDRLYGGKLMVDVVGFLNQLRDHQLPELVLTPGYGPAFATYIVNLPRAEIKGAELQITYRPPAAPGLTLAGAGGWQDSRVLDGRVPAVKAPANLNATAGAPGGAYDLTGTPLPLTPSFNASFRASYSRPVAGGVLQADLGYRWTDGLVLGDLAGQVERRPALGLVGVSISYSRSFYTLAVSARNLTNEVYLNRAVPSLFVHGWGDPRTVVVEIRTKF